MNHPLKNALPIVAAAYGEKFGVKVLIQGQDAFTDGERIVIPTANPDDPHYQQIAWGYLAHEAAHIRHTNFDISTGQTQMRRRRNHQPATSNRAMQCGNHRHPAGFY